MRVLWDLQVSNVECFWGALFATARLCSCGAGAVVEWHCGIGGFLSVALRRCLPESWWCAGCLEALDCLLGALDGLTAGGAIRTLTLFFFNYGIHSLMFRGYPPTAIGYTPTAIGYTPTAIGYPPTAIGYPPAAIGYPPAAIGYPPTAIGYPPAAIGYPPAAIGYPPTAIGYPPAAIVGRIGHSNFVIFFSLRHPLPLGALDGLTVRCRR